MKEHEISVTKRGYKRFFEGSTKKRIEYCKDKDGILCYYELFKDTLVVFQSSQN